MSAIISDKNAFAQLCRELAQHRSLGLDTEFMKLVSRLGGLVVFRDLEHESSWRALEHEQVFLRFRLLALTHGAGLFDAIQDCNGLGGCRQCGGEAFDREWPVEPHFQHADVFACSI